MKLKIPTTKQIILFLVLAFIALSVCSMFISNIKTILGLFVLGVVLWASIKLYRSTPYERIQWGKNNKFLGLFFKETAK